jgi:hypothetical protein
MRSASSSIVLRAHCLTLILVALAATAGVANAGDLLVICNSGVAIQPGDVKDVFLGEKSFAGTVKLTPADNGAAQAVFLEKALKFDLAKYASIWTKKSFRDGANPPSVKGSDAEAIAFVKQTPGGCSYITSPAPGGVAVIAKY